MAGTDLDELDRLHAAATGQRLTPSPVAFEVAATQAWPSISARLRAAEAEVERLRGLCGEAAEHIDPMRWGHGTAGERALVARLARAALGEP